MEIGHGYGWIYLPGDWLMVLPDLLELGHGYGRIMQPEIPVNGG